MTATEQHLHEGDRALTWAEVAQGLQRDAQLRDQLSDAIRRCEHAAVFWETVPVSPDTADMPFAMTLVDSPALARVTPERNPFPGELGGPATVARFANLSGDSQLIAPRCMAARECYPHLAAFVRGAPGAQVHDLWIALGAAVTKELQARAEPLWVSTSGLAVPWLHVRLDRRPKYVTTRRFRSWPRTR